MDSTIDIKKLRDDRVLENVGKEIAKAFAKFCGLKKTSETKKEEQELVFSSPTIREVVEKLMKDKKAQKEFIQKGIAAKAFNQSWMDKYNKGELEEHDIIGLCTIYALFK